MTEPTPTIKQLQELPVAERPEALEALVVKEFKATLLMADDEELPVTESFFELGFTSLRVTEAKQRLEDLLGCGISANVLFNSPTVEQLVTYLKEEVLTDVLNDPGSSDGDGKADPAAAGGRNMLWDDVMSTLYQS